MPALASGLIAMWSGAIVDIPDGWGLCDGSAGTPDLRDLFVVGAGNLYDPGDSGGASNHAHTFTSDGHTHTLDAGTDIQAGAPNKDVTTSDTDSGDTDQEDNLPPYYALAYIMFL